MHYAQLLIPIRCSINMCVLICVINKPGGKNRSLSGIIINPEYCPKQGEASYSMNTMSLHLISFLEAEQCVLEIKLKRPDVFKGFPCWQCFFR